MSKTRYEKERKTLIDLRSAVMCHLHLGDSIEQTADRLVAVNKDVPAEKALRLLFIALCLEVTRD